MSGGRSTLALRAARSRRRKIGLAVPPCQTRGCADDPAPPHDRIAGNIGLIAALETVAEEGAVGRDVARRHLRRLRGKDRP